MSELSADAAAVNIEFKELLDDIARDEGFHEYKIQGADGSVKGDGYMGIITSVNISGKDRSGKDKTVHLIIKSAPKSEALRNQASVATLFQREAYMYDTVFNTFQLLELEKSLLPCTFLPKFYRAQIVDKSEFLILENLKESGYQLYERRIPMDDAHVSLVMAEYGRLHALSFALRDQNPNKFKEVVGSMDDQFIAFIKKTNFTENFVQKCVKAKQSLNSESDKDAIVVYDTFLNTINQFIDELLHSVDNYAVALHGDCWTNNMMFKYENQEIGLKPSNVCFFDFQISRQGSPVLDLSYFFYTCSPKEIINNLDHYLRLYYDSFATYLKKLGSDPEKMFPYSVLQQHWKRYAKYGLIFAMLIIHVMLTEKEEIIDLADVSDAGNSITQAFDYEIGKYKLYMDRVRPIILHFIHNNFF